MHLHMPYGPSLALLMVGVTKELVVSVLERELERKQELLKDTQKLRKSAAEYDDTTMDAKYYRYVALSS